MEPSSSASSKITVEYHDPSGVFPLISGDLASRLPLRNLNWQSPPRPLRQIKSLHVDFVADSVTQQTSARPTEQRLDPNGPAQPVSSFDILHSGRDPAKDAVKERRHQVPGLKTSPYLKIYVLRCDDKDTYKETERKRIRDWIKETAPSDAKGRDNHNVSEWMVLHVVIPDTIAASEPRWKEASSSKDKESDEFKERPKSSAKWPGKSTRTVFDRLRADFNESSKSGSPDRIAQIRLRKTDVPVDLLPTPAIAPTLEDTAQERENSWNDIIAKLKILILGPFDARVRQYEADIALQESRRTLPGWNFCTFFIHKEGLAKALESIGLVEDALAIYDELALGLETVVRELASGQAQGTATTFANHTEDIETRIIEMNKSLSSGTGSTPTEAVPDLFNKDYRAQIVRSEISIFDFFSYLFSRQRALVLRLANSRRSRAEFGSLAYGKDGGEDLVLMSEVCWRASNFLHNLPRTLKQDLLNKYGLARRAQLLPRNNANIADAYHISKSNDCHTGQTHAAIENLVASWTYTVAEQILDETFGNVYGQKISETTANAPNGTLGKRSGFSFAMGADPYPQRMSSLTAQKHDSSGQTPRTVGQIPSTLASLSNGSSPFSSTDSAGDSTLKLTKELAGLPGQAELATYRAELIMMQRKVLELLAERRGWRAGWSATRYTAPGSMDDISLDENTRKPANDVPEQIHDVQSLCPALASALDSEVSFFALYEDLSDQAMRQYTLATQIKTAEAILADLAMLKYQQAQFADASVYFQHILPKYATEGWGGMEVKMLATHVQCLKKLERDADYVRAGLDLLAKVYGKKMARQLPEGYTGKDSSHLAKHDDAIDVVGLLPDLVSCSAALTEEVTSSLSCYICDLDVERQPTHYEDRDGFALSLHGRCILDDALDVDKVKARLVAVDDPSQEIWVESASAIKLKQGTVNVKLESSTVTFGAYLVDRIVVKAKKLLFVQELQPKPAVPILIVGDTELKTSSSSGYKRGCFVFLYPVEQAFDATIELSRDLHLGQTRHLKITLGSGWNQVRALDLKLKPTSAGLRLHLADAEFEGINNELENNVQASQIHLQSLAMHSSATVKIPYTLEQPSPEISVKFEVRYRTEKGSFTFLSAAKFATELPLDVDVNDLFHLDALFSSFTIRAMNGMPLLITHAELDDSPCYSVEGPPVLPLPMTVFDKHPGRLAYKIIRKAPLDVKSSKKEAALALRLQYQPYDELAMAALRKLFTSDLERSRFSALRRLLLPILSQWSRQSLVSADLTMAALMGESKIPAYDEISWQEVTDTLGQDVRQELDAWLKNWHTQNTHLSIHSSGASELAKRCITMAVEVPSVDVVHSVSMSLLQPKDFSAQGPRILTLGQPVKAEVKLRQTDIWSAQRVFGSGKHNHGEKQALRFVLDIQADPDIWLIGGQRRVHFGTVPTDGELAFEPTLMPLRPGLHPLPTIEVRIAEVADGVSQDKPIRGTAPSAISCETHYSSAGQVVSVIRDVRTSRVHIGEMSAVIVSGQTIETERPGTSSTKEKEIGGE